MIKVELPTMEAQRLLEQWEDKAQQLEGELSELMTAIASVKAQLNGKLPEQRTLISQPGEGKKRKKGQNLRVIQSFLESMNGRGLTIAEISERTEVGKSSVYLIVTKHLDVFTKGDDGLWYLKKR